MNDFNELNDVDKKEQDDFNKRFLVKFMIFMFFYRFYTMHIDQKGILIGCVDEFVKLLDQSPSNSEDNFPIDELD